MKNFYLSLLFVAISFFANAQDCYWAKKAGGTQDDQAYSITTDKSGNICVTGGLQSPNAVFGTYTLTGTGGVFVAKYSPSGNVLWAKRLNTGGQGNSIATDANGNIYVAGNFGGTFTLGTYTLTDHGQGDIFVAKFDSMGNVLWGKSIGGSVFDEGKGVTTDYLGNTYFTGHFYSDTVIFANDTLINKKNPSTGTNIPDIIIGKFDSSGNPLWAKRAGGKKL